MFYLKKDGKTTTRNAAMAGAWELGKAAELCLKEPNHDAMLAPGVAGKWKVIIPETVGFLLPNKEA